jgi:hypothetical protein
VQHHGRADGIAPDAEGQERQDQQHADQSKTRHPAQRLLPE